MPLPPLTRPRSLTRHQVPSLIRAKRTPSESNIRSMMHGLAIPATSAGLTTSAGYFSSPSAAVLSSMQEVLHHDYHHYRVRKLTGWRQGTGARYARSLGA